MAQSTSPSTMHVIYVYDALCGWCYGFSPVIEEFAQQHAQEITLEVVSGGMITGERVGPIGDVAPYIKTAYKTVEEHTGVRFGSGFLEDILEEGTAEFNSVPAALALAVFRTQRPDQTLAFAARLQKAVYGDGLAPTDLEGYGALAAEFGLDAKKFVEELQAPRFLALAQEEFERTQALGVQGFPTVFLQKGDQLYRLSSGYVSLEQLEAAFQSIVHP